MVIVIMGGRCCGKSTLANAICEKVHADVYTNRAYLQMDDDETEAKVRFMSMLDLAQTTEDYVIYLINDPALTELLPPCSLRVLCKTTLKNVKKRFEAQLGEKLTPPVAAMLEKQYRSFDGCAHAMALDPTSGDTSLLAAEVLGEAQLLVNCFRAGKEAAP